MALYKGQQKITPVKVVKKGDSGTDRLQWKCDNIKSLQYECYNSTLENVDEMFNGLDTSKVTNTGYMFYGCSNLSSIDLSNFNTSSVTYIDSMFEGCSGLTTLNISNFNTSNVTTMHSMFFGCSKLTSIDLSNFNTSKVTTIRNMFGSCSSLTRIVWPNSDTSEVTDCAYTFNNCVMLNTVSGTIDLIGVTYDWNFDYMFNNCKALTTVTLKNIKKTLQIGSGTSYGTLLDDPTIINTAKELWDLTGTTSQKLTVATAVSAKLDTIYVKLINATEEMIANDPNITSKKPCEVCSETDEGAMTLREYIVSKNWTISG